MSDYFPAEIRIGGRIPAVLVPEFLGQVQATGALTGGYEGERSSGFTADDLTEALDEDRHLYLVDDQARFGMFEDLEAFCVRHGIPFDRHSDAKYEYDAENVFFRPGMKEPETVLSNNDGDRLLKADDVRPIAVELTELVQGKPDVKKLRELSERLTALLPLVVEDLPPLKVVE